MSVLSVFITLAVATAQAPAVEGDAWLPFRTAEPDSVDIDHTRHGLTRKLNDNFSQLMFIDFNGTLISVRPRSAGAVPARRPR